MAPERLVVCGTGGGRGRGPGPLELDIYRGRRNVRLQLQAVRRALWTDVPPVLRDLLDLAAYVTAADAAVTRADGGRVDGAEFGAGWRRRFRFRVAVRDPDRWAAAPVSDALVSVLGFLSEDEYAFEFVPLAGDASLAGHIDFDDTPFTGVVEAVQLFSGGLDSLAGAVDAAVVRGRQVLLPHHRSTGKLAARHDRLVRELQARAGGRAPVHFPVWANRVKALGREFTQRTRSFLFAALGATFARMVGLDGLSFYEHEVISLNLPPSPQVVGARASRTTHPRTLAGFQALLTAVLGRRFTVDNPFQWDTKADVVRRVVAAGCGPLVGLSMSCAHTHTLESCSHTHCGTCSQCLDRRFAVLAAGAEGFDPESNYGVDLLVGDRPGDEARTMLAGYLELAERVSRMGEATFLAEFGELARALPHLGMPAAAGAARAFALYKAHARDVTGVVRRAVADHLRELRRQELPPGCLLRVVYDGQPPAAAAVGPPANAFARRGECWAVRFAGGEEQVYVPDVGLEYLRLLLGNPGTPFAAARLSALVRTPWSQRRGGVPADDGDESVSGSARGFGADDTLDVLAEEEYEAELAVLDEAIAAAEASGSPGRVDVVDELQAKRRRIAEELARARRLGKRRRKLGGTESDRARTRVGNALTRALEKIAAHDKPLAAHLVEPNLIRGGTLCYRPDPAVAWEIRT